MATKKARILVATRIDDIDYQPNQVIEADVRIIKSMVNSGVADDAAAGVNYCISEEGAQVLLHETAEVTVEDPPEDPLQDSNSAGK